MHQNELYNYFKDKFLNFYSEFISKWILIKNSCLVHLK